ncbi:MAG: hypothetical protein CSA81_05265 [Acidobacteria bacterium]|nr:MAG: hypothetical protein CSA81_05265 [Acidobacteriota bacterium]
MRKGKRFRRAVMLKKSLLKTVLGLMGLLVLVYLGIQVYNNRIRAAITREVDELAARSEILKAKSHLKSADFAVLLLHGYGGSPYDYEPLEKHLKRAGISYRIALLPGHGTSAWDFQKADAKSWLTAVEKEFNDLKSSCASVAVVGFSMGGALTAILAAEKEVDSIVLLSPYFQVTDQWYYIGKPETWSAIMQHVIPFAGKFSMGMINDPKGRETYFSYRFLPLNTVSELAQVGTLAREKVQHIECPVLWFHSTGDFVADFPLSREMYDQVPSSNKRFIEMQKSDHILLYDYDREPVIQELMQYLIERKKLAEDRAVVETLDDIHLPESAQESN